MLVDGIVIGGRNVPSPFPSSTVSVLLSAFPTTRSTNPSPLKSPVTAQMGWPPVGTLSFWVKDPSPTPRKMLTALIAVPANVELVTARSGMPSPLKSPVATKVGAGFSEIGSDFAVNVPSPLPIRIATDPCVVGTSRIGSTNHGGGGGPTGGGGGGTAATLYPPKFATAISGLPSPLKSATAIETGVVPVVRL